MGNNTDQGYLLLGCQYIRKQLDALARHTQGARTAEDVEDVHQARVASRRLRAALTMFGECFPAKQSRPWQNRIRKLTKGLGAARDLDVQILSLEQTLNDLDESDRRCRTGIQRLHLRLTQTRDTVQPQVVKVIDKLDQSQVLSDMVGEIARLLFLLQSQAVTVESEAAQARCRDYIDRCVEGLFTWEPSLGDPAERDGHHAMRIAAKKLRYTLEIANPSFGKRLNGVIKQVKRGQTLLGEIHDCDVWIDQIGAFEVAERKRTIAYYGHDRPYRTLGLGLTYLQETRRTRRQQLFTEFATTWERQKQGGLWDRLRQTINKEPTPPEKSGDEPVTDAEDHTDEANQEAPPLHPDSAAG